MSDFKALMVSDDVKHTIAEYSAKHIDEERLARLALMAWNETPGLQKCEPLSVLQAVIAAAACGLEFGIQSSSQCYLVPYGKKCQMIPSYRGLIDLCMRSGKVTMVDAHVVRENDEYYSQFGTDPLIRHRRGEDPRGEITKAYAIARLSTGEVIAEEMTVAEINEIRGQSAAGKSGPWSTHYSEMARKTVIRRLCKRLPQSVEINNALKADDKAEQGYSRTISANVMGTDQLVAHLQGQEADDGDDGSV